MAASASAAAARRESVEDAVPDPGVAQIAGNAEDEQTQSYIRARNAGGSKATSDSASAAKAVEGCWHSFKACGRAVYESQDWINLAMLCIILVAIVLLMVLTKFGVVLVPLVLLPSILAFSVYPYFRPSDWSKDERRKEHLRQLDQLFVRAFCIAGTVGFVISLTIETLLTAAFVSILFSAEAVKEARNAFAARFSGKETSTPVGVHLDLGVSTIVFLLLSAFIASACSEEGIKAFVVRFNMCGRVRPDGSGAGKSRMIAPACGQPDHLRTLRVTTLLLVAAAIGLATMENMVYTIEDSSSLERAFGTVFARSLVALPMQIVGGIFTAASFSTSDFAPLAERWGWPMCLLRAILFHGTYDVLNLVTPMILKRGFSVDSEVVLTLVNFAVALTTVIVGAFLAFRSFRDAEQAIKQYTKLAEKDAADKYDRLRSDSKTPLLPA
jgi:RsiW-degrading membrane proteinase PrsW (M82 family)